MLGSIKLAFFLALWFYRALFYSQLFKAGTKLMNDEMMLIVSLALVWHGIPGNTGGFSSALGAFIMGSILLRPCRGKIEPCSCGKELFGAIFFSSVGMFIDPQMLLSSRPDTYRYSGIADRQALFVTTGALSGSL
jgi:CPA2 family monovalent cation:H+ antiporter-2